MVDLTGKTALVTGGARGQGRSHALALAQAGASVAILDVCEDLENVSYPLASQADMDETMRLINEANGKALAVKADVRDREAISDAVARIVDTFGSLDILAINHGVMAISEFRHMDPADWDVVIDINLNGVFNVLHAGLPHLLNQTWGRVIITSSMAGKGGYPQFSHYSASKWAVIGLAKTVALEVATTGTTVNVICPCCVDTPIIHNSTMYRLFRPDLDSPTIGDVAEEFCRYQPQGIPWIPPQAITDALMFLVSDGAKHMTGETLSVAAGQNANGAA
ncbi:mycofactocin-coupled SDR family oxidoreductase [Rhodococcus opacus]|uniref:3-oxoacyl-[acyl-carrier-protein] reductase MabA n=2 Tax=Rhodococcus opacus TaxID=37919 RepID=A0AAX3YBS5_RHOOP|nr:mycofactocin-coupled SDR family oxidoreductase [Rhodococcus opacus]MCZ4589059.1 mycofactocin-coupled SDR family oxidoreductase [Rhodococcus opacus]MDV6242074.1 mycofactocin-coupled SDR family oxidoreductase [Rhodococcus opacus]QZS59050.1 mycofactocin-coupled SDR family oxidoreductase [Rhodococcus opacus]RKM74373.1 SDR family mycofactocin-dependent oxidoreductase [Rhodococcus opacus]UZG55047.1 mycofactocin-coupled SDR family oxidoreductase [Rhodococcus opacus]